MSHLQERTGMLELNSTTFFRQQDVLTSRRSPGTSVGHQEDFHITNPSSFSPKYRSISNPPNPFLEWGVVFNTGEAKWRRWH